MSQTMTSRERVYATLRHEEPDRVPIDFGGNYNTRVNVIAYNRLKKYLGISSKTYSRVITAMVASPDLDEGLEIMKRMGGDIIELPPHMFANWERGLPVSVAGETMEFKLKDGTLAYFPPHPRPVEKEDGDMELVFGGVPVFRMPKNGYYFDRIHSPLGHIEDLNQLKEMLPEWGSRGYYGSLKADFLDQAARFAKLAFEQTDYFIVANMPGNLSVYHVALEFFGYEKFLMFMAADPDLVHHWMEFTTQANEERLTAYLNAVGPYINGFIIGDDYGTQKGLQISPKMFRDLIKPYLTRICSLIHKICPHAIVLKHACGSIAPIIPDLIECGIDAINPVQTTARNMGAAFLKKEFGKDVTFWGGGVSCQSTMFSGTVADVRQEVKEKLEIFSPGGGYVFCADHDIQEHVQPDMIEAVFQSALEFGS